MKVEECKELRRAIKPLAEGVIELWRSGTPSHDMPAEVFANIMLAYRHLEDAGYRLGKALQAHEEAAKVRPLAKVV